VALWASEADVTDRLILPLYHVMVTPAGVLSQFGRPPVSHGAPCGGGGEGLTPMLRWLTGKRAMGSAPTSGSSAPLPARLPIGPGGNPLHSLFDAWHLPWREPRSEVEAREGIRRDPLYDDDVMFVRDAVVLPGTLRPWNAGIFERFAPTLPITRFTAIAWFADDAAANIECMAAWVAERIGPAPIGPEYNTDICRWRAGGAELQLMTWPPERQSPGLANNAFDREPRLHSAVHLTATTGFRLPLSEREDAWMRSFRPVAMVAPQRTVPVHRVGETAPGETELEYARDPGEYLRRTGNNIGYPPDAAALIFCTHQLFIVPREDVLGFVVMRLHRAKGPGGSSLQVRCRTPCPVADKTLHLTSASDPDGVTALGRALATAFDVPCEVSPPFPDA